MTSVVDTSVKHFHSGMAGAPVLSGTAGALVALLDACLVNGFDVKAATSLVVAGGVATLSFAGTRSATVDSVILVTGSSIATLNGEQKVTALGSGFVQFATAAADGTSAGGVSFKMAPAGWVSPFTGTNLSTYKSADPASTGMILRVADTTTTMCRVVGYESMTDIDTGAGAFPTTAQMSGGGYWAKSGSANSKAVSWMLACDGRKFILHVAPYSSTNAAYLSGVTRGFGDDIAMRPGGDPYACSLNYSSTSSVGVQFDGPLDFSTTHQNAVPRSYTGLGSCVLHGSYPYVGTSACSGTDDRLGGFPSLVDGGLRLSSKYLYVSGSNPRSDLPGLYHVPMSLAFDTFKVLDSISGTGALVGRRLMVLNPVNTTFGATPTATSTGVSFVDITGPWR